MNAFDTQVGGDHYKNFAIQPAEFCELNKLSHLESNIVKRICRWRKKDGIKDLKKIKHEVDMLVALYFNEVPEECPHGHGKTMRYVLKGEDDEPKQRQGNEEGSQGDERRTHTTFSEQHERGYTLHATDLASR